MTRFFGGFMKKVITIAALSAVLLTVIPANGMFGRMGSRLIKAGALLGAYTGYIIRKDIEMETRFERNFDCSVDLARLTYEKLRSEQFHPWSTDAYKQELRQAFFQCQQQMPRNEVFDKNIDYANKSATFWAHMGSPIKMTRFGDVAQELQYKKDNFDCYGGIAKLTYDLLKSNESGYSRKVKLEEAFKYCQKSMPRQKIYTENIYDAEKNKYVSDWEQWSTVRGELSSRRSEENAKINAAYKKDSNALFTHFSA
jgi:hypothetical protein